jgi:photosystem II stability/assembly factor-like uncharacterized protein
VIDPRNSVVYLGLWNGAVFKSLDEAENWKLSSHGMSGEIYITDLAIDPGSSGTVFAAVWGEGHSLAKTANKGTTWEYLPNSATDLGAVAIYTEDPQIIWAGDGLRWDHSFFVYKSTDGGQNWTPSEKLFQFTPSPDYTQVKDLIIKPDDPDSLIVGTDFTIIDDEIRGAGVLVRSTDGGKTWEPLVASLLELPATTLATDPNDPGIVYRGKRRIGEVFRHTNVWGNCTYTNITPPGGIGDVRDIEIDSDSTVYVATSDGLWIKNGSDWTKIDGLPTDNIVAIAIDRNTNPDVVHVGTRENGVFISNDGGSSWSNFSQGLGSLNITKLAISNTQPKMLYAGTSYAGVWNRSINYPCQCDFTPADGDVDGSDLAAYIADQAGISLSVFAAEFGRTNCP